MELALSIICDELAYRRPDILSEPLARYEKTCGLQSIHRARPQQTVHGVRMLRCIADAETLDSTLLYIARKDQLLPDDPPSANILCAGALSARSETSGGFRVIELAEDADVHDVFDAVLEIFERYDRWHDDFVRAVMECAPVTEILDIGCRLFRNPVSFVNPALENVALAGAKLPDNIEGSILETILEKGYSPFEAIEEDERDRLVMEIEDRHSPYLSRPQQAYSDNCFLIAPIADGNRLPPALASTDICEPFTDGQVELMALVADGIEIRLRLTRATSHALNELALVAETILRGTTVDRARMTHALKRYRWHAEDDYVLVCLPDGESAIAEAVVSRIVETVEEVLVIQLDEQAAIVINHTQASEDGDSLNQLDMAFAHMGVCGGASYVTKGFVNINRAFEQAQIASQVASRKEAAGILHFEDECLECIVCTLEQHANPLSLVHPAVIALAAADAHGTLVDTLACFLRNGGNMSRTSRDLFLHRSTLAYRLNQIESATAITLKELSDDEIETLFISCLIFQRQR